MQFKYEDTVIEFKQIASAGSAVWEARAIVSEAQAILEPWHDWLRGYGTGYTEAAIDLLRAQRHVRLCLMPTGELPY